MIKRKNTKGGPGKSRDTPVQDNRDNEVAELKRQVSEMRAQVKARAYLPWMVYSLAGLVALQAGAFLLWTWNLRVVEREWVPNLDARVRVLEAFDPVNVEVGKWLAPRAEALERMLDGQGDFEDSPKPQSKPQDLAR